MSEKIISYLTPLEIVFSERHWSKYGGGNTTWHCIPSMWCQRGMGQNMAEKLLLVTDMSHVHPYKMYSQRGMGQNMVKRLLCFYKKIFMF